MRSLEWAFFALAMTMAALIGLTSHAAWILRWLGKRKNPSSVVLVGTVLALSARFSAEHLEREWTVAAATVAFFVCLLGDVMAFVVRGQ